MNTEKSKKLFEEAKKYIPGGVNSPVRAFKSVGGDPLFIQRGEGSKFCDVDGNEYHRLHRKLGTTFVRTQSAFHNKSLDRSH